MGIRKGQSSSRVLDSGKLAALLKIKGNGASADVFWFKERSKPHSLFSDFNKVFGKPELSQLFHGVPFPRNLSELFSVAPLYSPVNPINEIIWAISYSLQFGPELRSFVSSRERFENSLMKNAESDCEAILEEIEHGFGFSLWLIQNRLSIARYWKGIEEARKVLRIYEEGVPEGSILKFVLWFISRRTEATAIRDHLKSELARALESINNQSFSIFVRNKLFELPSMSVRDIAPTLFWDGLSCAIDYYETLIACLQAAASDNTLPYDVANVLERPLHILYKKTKDVRLLGAMRGLGIRSPVALEYDCDRAGLIEAYTRGLYQEVLRGAGEYLVGNVGDMSVHILRIKSAAKLGVPLAEVEGDGLLNEIAEKLSAIFSTSSDTYAAAYDLLTLSDKFYCHSWSTYLRATVLYELRQESAEFPPLWLSDIYVRDPYLSPFSAISASGNAKRQILDDVKTKSLFPYTFAAYRAITAGEISNNLSIDEVRINKYLGRFHLAFGDARVALKHFTKLLGNATGIDWIRCAASAALSHLKLGEVQEAADIVVDAFIVNQNMPNILPITEVVGALGDSPSEWPESISIPLVFELYLANCERDKLSHLRFSFERFQMANNIRSPENMSKDVERFGVNRLVAYMDRVWRPEVMRQTVLYSGTKEIEDTRVKVCQALVELDPLNSAKYIEEIKERVKQQEIAKGTTLIEQSKMYVDVEAIKKALRTRLSDSYARYKISSQAESTKKDSILRVAELIGRIGADSVSVPSLLAKMHFVDGDKTESDAQFAAIFSEVTNEFLRGGHGLNAYLSTRVRHGTLSNTLRKPVADENLVTEREEGGGRTYRRNEYWVSRWEDGSYQHEWKQILDSLDEFSKQFDNVVENIRDRLIQIRVVEDLQEEGGNQDALFVYRTSNVERRFVQAYEKNMSDLDEFVGYCVDILWEKTDANLTVVQGVLDTQIRTQLMQTFDELANHLTSVSYVPGVSEIMNAVARARTYTQTRLGLVISWFKRSEVYDRQDYMAEFPFQIALNMINNTMSGASSWNDARSIVESGSDLMPGRTLDGMVYVFYGLLENAILHAGLKIDELRVNSDISFKEGRFSAKITNPINPACLTDKEREKVERLRVSLHGGEAMHRAQSENRSGLHKIWLTINSPIYKEPSLNFYHDDGNSFVVEIGFKLERSGNERLVD